MSGNKADEDFPPPPGPPPLLNQDQLVLLAQQGFLPLPLSEGLTSDLQCLFQHLEAFYDQSVDVKKSLYPQKLGTRIWLLHCGTRKGVCYASLPFVLRRRHHVGDASSASMGASRDVIASNPM